ncbi:MAG: hypothetical protein ACHQ50_17100, partial [Fimbriimonadales bacterium]
MTAPIGLKGLSEVNPRSRVRNREAHVGGKWLGHDEYERSTPSSAGCEKRSHWYVQKPCTRHKRWDYLRLFATE